MGSKGAASSSANTDLLKDVKNSHPAQQIPSNSNPSCELGLFIWAH